MRGSICSDLTLKKKTFGILEKGLLTRGVQLHQILD